MRKLLQINTVGNSGSTGRIAEEIGQMAIANGWLSYIAYARNKRPSNSHLIRIGNDRDIKLHGLQTRIFDRHGLGSRKATYHLIKEIEELGPDIIHLHNIHGYYVNYPILFDYLKKSDIPVVWTLHDCWPFTGHCSHFTFIKCNRWKSECYDCPQKKEYPSSIGFDRSNKNHKEKKRYFTKINKLTLVPVSKWLGEITHQSFLGKKNIHPIYNGIDTNIFAPKPNKLSVIQKYHIRTSFLIVGVASVWTERKGLNDFIKLSELISKDMTILLIGLTSKQIKNLPSNIIGIKRTENIEELADIYSAGDVYINTSTEETFGLTTAESLACGTPAIVYNSTACPEVITNECGFIVEANDIEGLVKSVNVVKLNGKHHYSKACRNRIMQDYQKENIYKEYINLYNQLLQDEIIE